jgi:CRP/FNR family cyclic AMP-dependent transcriptional regulator
LGRRARREVFSCDGRLGEHERKCSVSDTIFYILVTAAWLQTLAALVSTFSKTMIPLRFASVLANICGLLVSAASANAASLLRHLVILPIDVIRLREMRKLVACVKDAAASDLNVEWLKPFMYLRRSKRGETLFHKGDPGNEAFMLIEGEVELSEVGGVLFPGALFGEMALFAPQRSRTATAFCRTDVRLLFITYEQFERLYFQNSEFGFYLLRLIVNRLA